MTINDYVVGPEFIERRRAADAARIVENGIVVAEFNGQEAGAKYLRDNMIPMHVAQRVIARKQRRAEDWK